MRFWPALAHSCSLRRSSLRRSCFAPVYPASNEEHGKNGEPGRDGKYQQDDLKHSIYTSKLSICDNLFVNHFAALLVEKIITCSYTRLKNMTLGQLKIGERQATCGGLNTTYNWVFVGEIVKISLLSVIWDQPDKASD